jgi:predicted Zn-dependent protease
MALLDHVLTMPDRLAPSPIMVIQTAAQELRAHGRAAAADAALQRPLAKSSAGSSGRAARALYLMQRWEVARALHDSLTLEFPDNISHLGHRGVVEARLGDAAAARRTSQQLAKLQPRWGLGTDTQWRASIAAVLGEKVVAVELLREALAQGANYTSASHSDPALIELRGYRPYDDLMRPIK